MNCKINVINFHLTERCNYKCCYCFAKFNNKKELTFEEWCQCANIVKTYFKGNEISDCRINLAGGEPLLLDYLDKLIDYICSLNIKVSIITNGTMLTRDKIDKWVNKVETIGVSIDSLNHDTNAKIGRICKSKSIDIDKLIEVLHYAKSKGIKIKVNTVVSKLNLSENLREFYQKLISDRIKILQIKINYNCNENALKYSISSKQFANYCKKLKGINNLVVESEKDIESSYIIIDSNGMLIANSQRLHQQTGSVFNYKLEDLILKADINYEKFENRYRGVKNGTTN